jgi:hypothetical protein
MKLSNNLISYHNLLAYGASLNLIFLLILPTIALPPKEDTPEEVLRTEIIIEGRSPLDNQPLTPAEYAQLRQKLATSKYPPEVNSQLRHKIFLLQILKFFRTIIP